MIGSDLRSAENLLRCWVRERGVRLHPDRPLVIETSGTRITATVRHLSPVGCHRFTDVRIGDRPADLPTLAALVTHAAADSDATDGDAGVRVDPEMVRRILDSTERIARYRDPVSSESTPGGAVGNRFLTAEQSLRAGHPFHPAPKSREGWTARQDLAYSPETGAGFALHWFAADPDLVSTDSAMPVPASELLAGFADVTGSSDGDGGDGMVVPAHPWQAGDLCLREPIRRLLRSGRLRYLGPAGPDWYPTSSVRTVFRPDTSVMLKLSLGLAITNSRRENLRKELHRGVEVARLLDTGLRSALDAAHPGFAILPDPAWLAVDLADDASGRRPSASASPDPTAVDSGLDVMLRMNPFGGSGVGSGGGEGRASGATGDVRCVAALAEEGGAAALHTLPAAVADPAAWLAAYIRRVLAPVLWLHATFGIGLEAHQQNTLVALDRKGSPVGGWYRDNQGYYFARSRVGHLRKLLPGAGIRSDTVVDDEVVDERIGYYVGINNLLGLIGAFGALGLADEAELLAVTRTELADVADSLIGTPSAVLDRLLSAPSLRCKANLLTRLHRMDELVGPVASQSVYVDIDNPLLGSAR